MDAELLSQHNVPAISAVLNVGPVERHRLRCLKVLGDTESRRSRSSWYSVKVIGVAAWPGVYRRLKMWTHRLKRFDDRFSSLFSCWLTGGIYLHDLGELMSVQASLWFVNRSIADLGMLELVCCKTKNSGTVLLQVWLAATSSSHKSCWGP